MNNTQVITTSSTLVAVVAGYAAGHGWLGLNTADWTTVVGGIVAAGTILVPAIVTRARALKDTVGKMPATTVVTDKATADALPGNPDVIAATPEIVAAIKKQSGSTTGASV